MAKTTNSPSRSVYNGRGDGVMDVRVVYIDVVFLTNLIINYFLLLASAKICARPARRARCLLGAAFGGAYAVLLSLGAAAFLSGPAFKILSGFAMLLLAFGPGRRFARLALVFFGVSAAAAGAVTAAGLFGGARSLGNIDARVLAAAFGVFYLAATLVFRRAARETGRIMTLTLAVETREVTLRALRDTGNSLCDPITGARAAVVAARDSLPLFPERTRAAVAEAVESRSPEAWLALNELETGVKFRLLPYSAVGVRGGMLPAFRPTRAAVDGRGIRDIVVALSPNDISGSAAYSALF
ncbi:MAG: sigma-E processing peptidase SpoIIGA [Oscillospiraceae bacterium]|nr:sigma-E processing peptidase SpoIIGA [Oscillospiraceae bacterium]